jgi:hypothetical protein
MLREFRRRFGDRRHGYSLRGHIARLKQEGRLPQIAFGAIAVFIVGGLTFGRCDSANITGPNETTAEAPTTTASGGSVVPAHSSGDDDDDDDGVGLPEETFTFSEKTVQRNVVFTGVNPCNGDAVRAEGTRYEKIKITARGDYFDSHHEIEDYFRGFAVNNPVQKYKGEDEHEHDMTITANGLDDQLETEEYLKAIGPEPDWKLEVEQRYRVRFDEPRDMKVYFRARASCMPTSRCTVVGGCVDREFTTVSSDETEVRSLPGVP